MVFSVTTYSLKLRKLIPRMLRPTTNRDMKIELFGEQYETPLFFSPVGVQSIFHQEKETGVAQIAAEIGVPFILSTAASSTIEEVAKANGPGGKRWFQLYWPHDDDITISVSLYLSRHIPPPSSVLMGVGICSFSSAPRKTVMAHSWSR